MDKQNMAYAYSGRLFSLKKESQTQARSSVMVVHSRVTTGNNNVPYSQKPRRKDFESFQHEETLHNVYMYAHFLCFYVPVKNKFKPATSISHL
jgi:hypothetical protein